MDAADSPVTLVIKAPNQKYEDHTITCYVSWTVERLKTHISNVYPSKPCSKDQRLVYSGRLLQDHLQLRDVLRKHDEYHMMHLVCTSHSPPGSPRPQSVSTTTWTPGSATRSEVTGSSPSVTSASQDGHVTSSSSSSSSSSVPERPDGLRHRGGVAQSDPQWSDGAQGSLHGGLPAAAAAPPHPVYMPMQMLWWQQMYARQYYMQYQAAVAASQPPGAPPSSPPSSSSSSSSPHRPDEAAPAPLGRNAAPNPLPEERPANPNIQMNAQGGPAPNEDEANRDWLDRLYTVSRAGVLLSIVYFYSSFSRFVMVVGAMLMVYLHQVGWFPFRPEQQNGRGGRGGANQEEAERHQDIQEMERLMDDGMDDDDEEGAGGSDDRARAGLPEPGFFTSAWSFISTFFTSLLPEGRPHPAN